jgi:hypothetical protein
VTSLHPQEEMEKEWGEDESQKTPEEEGRCISGRVKEDKKVVGEEDEICIAVFC